MRVVIVHRAARARSRVPARSRSRADLRPAGIAAGVDEPHRAVRELDDRGIALADVEERHAQRAGGRRRARERPDRAHRGPQHGVEPACAERAPRATAAARPARPSRAASRPRSWPTGVTRASKPAPASTIAPTIAAIAIRIPPRAGTTSPGSTRPASAERQREEQLDDRRQHEVADDAARGDLVKVIRGERRGRQRDPRRCREAAREPTADAREPAAADRARRGRAHRQRERGDERQLERWIEHVGRAPREQRDRGDAERVDEPHRSIEHRADEHQRDHDERAQRRELRAGHQRVRDREREGRRRRPPRRPHATTPRRCGDELAQEREHQAGDDREVQAADAEHVIDADRAPALIERRIDAAPIADRDPAQRRARARSRRRPRRSPRSNAPAPPRRRATRARSARHRRRCARAPCAVISQSAPRPATSSPRDRAPPDRGARAACARGRSRRRARRARCTSLDHIPHRRAAGRRHRAARRARSTRHPRRADLAGDDAIRDRVVGDHAGNLARQSPTPRPRDPIATITVSSAIVRDRLLGHRCRHRNTGAGVVPRPPLSPEHGCASAMRGHEYDQPDDRARHAHAMHPRPIGAPRRISCRQPRFHLLTRTVVVPVGLRRSPSSTGRSSDPQGRR